MNFTLKDGTRVHLIGDPHIGRKFEVGVPLKRKGEREAKLLAHLEKELDYDADIIVMVGDLFDHPYVGYAVAEDVAKAYRDAANRRPKVRFIAMAGNHDMPRNIEAVGAFHDFVARLDGRHSNLHIVTKPEVINEIALFPWEWNRRADEQVADLRGPAQAAVGHWDLATFNGKDDHLAPVDALRKAFGDIPLYGGHYHRPGDYTVGAGVVHCTGSLEPLTHDEDTTGEWYVTLSVKEALARDDLYDKHVRIRRKRGEDVPEIDCYALTYIWDKAVDEGATDVKSVDVKNWGGIMQAALAPLDERVRIFIEERLPANEESSQE